MASSAGLRKRVAAAVRLSAADSLTTKTSPYFSSDCSQEPPPKKPRKRPKVEVKYEKSETTPIVTDSKLSLKVSPSKKSSAAKVSAHGGNDSAASSSSWMPDRFEEHYDKICEMRKARNAPVDSMGAECCQDKTAPDNVRRFQTLVSLLLSSMTKDECTAGAMTRLQKHGLTVPNVVATSEADIGTLIYPVGFWRVKAANLKKTAAVLHEYFQDDIPSSIPGLVALPGIGPKMAHLCMLIAWDEVTGIGVDTHVHRISNRLKWVPKPTKTPEDTRKALEEWLPRKYWRTINLDLVGFGQQRCLPVGPKCSDCLISDTCPKFGVGVKKAK